MPLSKGKKDLPPVFDMTAYNREQIIEALNCPVNRHATRVEHKCDDWALHEHPEWLIEHFIRNGGAEAFAQRRKDFQRLCDKALECFFADICDLKGHHSGWVKCPVRDIGEKCIRCQAVAEMIKSTASDPSE